MGGKIMRHAILAVAAFFWIHTNSAAAEEFDIVQSRDTFVGLIDQRELTRFGIRLSVAPDGDISGRAFGTPVTGEWDWDGGYFCRDLFWGETNLGSNCQSVQVRGDTLRFTTDRGEGIFADLTLR